MNNTLHMVKGTLQRWSVADYAGMLLTLILISFFFLNTELHRVLFYLCLPVFILYLVSEKKRFSEFSASSLLGLIGLICGYALISLSWSDQSSIDSVCRVIKSVLFLSVFLATFVFTTLDKKQFWSRHIDLFLHVAAIFAVVILAYNYLYLGNYGRIMGLGRIENSIECAMVYGLCLIFLWGRSKDEGFAGYKHRTNIMLFYSFLFFALLFLTFSRGPLLAYIISVLCVFLAQGRWRMLGAMAGAAAVLLLTMDLSGILTFDYYNRGDSYRLDIWMQALDLWKQAPLLGHGFAMEHTFKISGYTAEEWSSTHNLILGTALYGGLIGVALLLAIFCTALIMAFKLARTGDTMGFQWLVFAAVISLFQFHSLFTNLNVEWLVLWLPIGYLIAARARRTAEAIPR